MRITSRAISVRELRKADVMEQMIQDLKGRIQRIERDNASSASDDAAVMQAVVAIAEAVQSIDPSNSGDIREEMAALRREIDGLREAHDTKADAAPAA